MILSESDRLLKMEVSIMTLEKYLKKSKLFNPPQKMEFEKFWDPKNFWDPIFHGPPKWGLTWEQIPKPTKYPKLAIFVKNPRVPLTIFGQNVQFFW